MHPLERAPVRRAVERAATEHIGRPWVMHGFTDLDDRACHPCGIYAGEPISVFAKLDPAGPEQFTAELSGLRLLRDRAGVATPDPVGTGVVALDGGAVLLLEAITEVPAARRSPDQWRGIGHALAQVHQVRDPRFGLDLFDNFFGPLPQPNQPVASNSWADFYAERRLLPRLREAADSGNLTPGLAAGVERVVARLPRLGGPDTAPALLHGDAQQNNFLTSATETVLLDVAPYFGHPEVDLALLDYFEPVPAAVFDGYREVAPIDPGFVERRELWRLHAYLAVITVSGLTAFGRPFLQRIADAVVRYR